MFHLPSNMPQPPPSTPWKPYDPRDFQPRNLGFCSQGVSKGRAVSGLEDVEMAGDSPARVGEKQDDKQVDEGEGVRMEDGKDESNRPVARGAVAREVRRRKKKAPRDIVKQGRYGDEDQAGDLVGFEMCLLMPNSLEYQARRNISTIITFTLHLFVIQISLPCSWGKSTSPSSGADVQQVYSSIRQRGCGVIRPLSRCSIRSRRP